MSLNERFMAHLGDCQQCREVMESFFAEFPQPHPFCEKGWAILRESLKESASTEAGFLAKEQKREP